MVVAANRIVERALHPRLAVEAELQMCVARVQGRLVRLRERIVEAFLMVVAAR